MASPLINFRYFEEGNDAAGGDLSAVVAGIKFGRRRTNNLEAQKLVPYFLSGDLEAVYAAIAIMSDSVRFATTGFISCAPAPFRLPRWMSSI
jgi:hypothetical protein